MSTQSYEHEAVGSFANGNQVATGPRENAREAGDASRAYRDYAASSGGGTVLIRRRTVTRGEWETVESVEVPGASS